MRLIPEGRNVSLLRTLKLTKEMRYYYLGKENKF